MPLIERFLKISVHITLETGVRYAFFASIAWLLAYVLFRKRWWHRKVVARAPLAADVRREMRDSAITLVIFGAVGAATVLAIKAGWTQMSFQPRHWAWFAGSVAAAILLHDAYFYWTHRLMHHPLFFRRFHRTHHLSTNPTPWAAYAFSPLEALVQAAIFPIVVLLIPIQPLGFAAFMIWQIIFNVAGHAGYEHHPRWLIDSWLGRIVNTPTNHIMHHEHFRGNYGLYFNVWDRLMGTNHERYEERFREVTSRRPSCAGTGGREPAKEILTRA